MFGNNSGKIIIIILLVVVVLIGATAGIVLFVKGSHSKHGKSKVPDGPKTLVSIGELVVNLADSDEVRYLKTDVVLELCGEVSGGGEGGEGGEGDSTKTKMRDAVIGILGKRHFAELNKPDGKDKLKEEIIKAADERLNEKGEMKVKAVNVYFNEFAMQ